MSGRGITTGLELSTAGWKGVGSLLTRVQTTLPLSLGAVAVLPARPGTCGFPHASSHPVGAGLEELDIASVLCGRYAQHGGGGHTAHAEVATCRREATVSVESRE